MTPPHRRAVLGHDTVERFRSELYGSCCLLAYLDGRHVCPGLAGVTWQHGWMAQERQVRPETVIQDRVRTYQREHLVARLDEVRFLKKHGIQARAVGLPFAYTEGHRVERVGGSVLLVPSHSTGLAKFCGDTVGPLRQLAGRVARLSDKRSVVIHASDRLDTRYTSVFSEFGYSVVHGADPGDATSLQRTRDLFDASELVIGDSPGSFLPYAASCGCSVAIIESGMPLALENGKSSREWDQTLGSLRSRLERELPWLYGPPEAAQTNVGWGLNEVGANLTVSPSEFVEIAGWTSPKARMMDAAVRRTRIPYLRLKKWNSSFRR